MRRKCVYAAAEASLHGSQQRLSAAWATTTGSVASSCRHNLKAPPLYTTELRRAFVGPSYGGGKKFTVSLEVCRKRQQGLQIDGAYSNFNLTNVFYSINFNATEAKAMFRREKKKNQTYSLHSYSHNLFMPC